MYSMKIVSLKRINLGFSNFFGTLFVMLHQVRKYVQFACALAGVCLKFLPGRGHVAPPESLGSGHPGLGCVRQEGISESCEARAERFGGRTKGVGRAWIPLPGN